MSTWTLCLNNIRRADWHQLPSTNKLHCVLQDQSYLHQMEWKNISQFCKHTLEHLPPVFFHSPTEGNLLADFCAHRICQTDLGQISSHSQNTTSSGQGADVHHQNLVLCQLLDLCNIKGKITSVFTRTNCYQNTDSEPHQRTIRQWKI